MTRAETKEQTRRQLLAASAVVFARAGYEGASVQEIAEEAGRTTGALYAHFASKEDLFLALLDERSAARNADLEGLVGVASNDELASWFEQRGRGDLGLLATEFFLFAARNADVRAKRRRQLRKERAALAAMLGAAYERAGVEPPRPVEDLAALYHAVADGLSSLRTIDPGVPAGELFAFAVHQLGRPR